MSNKQLKVKSLCSVFKCDRNSILFIIAKEGCGRGEPPFPSKARETVLGNGMQYHQRPRVLKEGVETVSQKGSMFFKKVPVP